MTLDHDGPTGLPADRLYSLHDASAYLGLSPRWLRQLALAGRIPAVRPTGGMWFLRESTIAEMLTPGGLR